MGRVGLGILVCLVVIGASVGTDVLRQEPSALAAAPPHVAQGSLVAFSSTVGGQFEQITVVDPVRQVLAVYRIEASSGRVRLCSVRSLSWDLQMVHFNNEQPLPLEIRETLNRGAAGY